MKKSRSIRVKLLAWCVIPALLIIWQLWCVVGDVPKYILPSPADVWATLTANFGILTDNAKTTLLEAFLGLAISLLLSFAAAALMDSFGVLYRALYPILVVTQTVPTVAVAPLLVIWFGAGMAPKIILITVVCFFPITVALLDGFKSADPEVVSLVRAMGGNRRQVFRHVKFPFALTGMFAGLKISVSYSVVGAVISEWVGGSKGLGVYMTLVKKAYSLDKMFAAIIIVIAVSLVLVESVKILEKALTPWRRAADDKKEF